MYVSTFPCSLTMSCLLWLSFPIQDKIIIIIYDKLFFTGAKAEWLQLHMFWDHKRTSHLTRSIPTLFWRYQKKKVPNSKCTILSSLGQWKRVSFDVKTPLIRLEQQTMTSNMIRIAWGSEHSTLTLCWSSLFIGLLLMQPSFFLLR